MITKVVFALRPLVTKMATIVPTSRIRYRYREIETGKREGEQRLELAMHRGSTDVIR